MAQGFSPAFFAALKGLRHYSHFETALVDRRGHRRTKNRADRFEHRGEREWFDKDRGRRERGVGSDRRVLRRIHEQDDRDRLRRLRQSELYCGIGELAVHDHNRRGLTSGHNGLNQRASTLRLFHKKVEMREVGHAWAPDAAVAVGDDHARMTPWTITGPLAPPGKPSAIGDRGLATLVEYHFEAQQQSTLICHY